MRPAALRSTVLRRPFAPLFLISFAALFLAGCGPNLFERVTNFWTLGCCGTIVVVLDIVALVELAGSARTTQSKVLWSLFIIFVPVLGCIGYYLFGRE